MKRDLSSDVEFLRIQLQVCVHLLIRHPLLPRKHPLPSSFTCGSSEDKLSSSTRESSGMKGRKLVPACLVNLTSWEMLNARTSLAELFDIS